MASDPLDEAPLYAAAAAVLETKLTSMRVEDIPSITRSRLKRFVDDSPFPDVVRAMVQRRAGSNAAAPAPRGKPLSTITKASKGTKGGGTKGTTFADMIMGGSSGSCRKQAPGGKKRVSFSL